MTGFKISVIFNNYFWWEPKLWKTSRPWLDKEEQLDVYELPSVKNNSARADALKDWPDYRWHIKRGNSELHVGFWALSIKWLYKVEQLHEFCVLDCSEYFLKLRFINYSDLQCCYKGTIYTLRVPVNRGKRDGSRFWKNDGWKLDWAIQRNKRENTSMSRFR